MGSTDSWEPQETDSAKKCENIDFQFLAHWYTAAAEGEFLKMEPTWVLRTTENLMKQILRKRGEIFFQYSFTTAKQLPIANFYNCDLNEHPTKTRMGSTDSWEPQETYSLNKNMKKSIFIFGSLLHSSCRWRISKNANRIHIKGPSDFDIFRIWPKMYLKVFWFCPVLCSYETPCGSAGWNKGPGVNLPLYTWRCRSPLAA